MTICYDRAARRDGIVYVVVAGATVIKSGAL